MGVKKNKKKQDETPMLSYYQIFRYATSGEVAVTIIGAILGFLSGGGVTFNLVQLGEVFTVYVDRTTNQPISNVPMMRFFGGGKSVNLSDPDASLRALVQDGTAIASGIMASCCVCIILCMLSVGLLNWSALRQITRIKNLFLKAALSQDMSWFDTDSEFNLASKMSDDMVKLKAGMGEKIAVVANLMGTAVLSFTIAFPLGWELALACASVVPFCIASSVFLTNYQTSSSARELHAYNQAGKRAEEVLKSVKTVVAFGGETKEVTRYRRLLEPAEQYGRRRGLYTGLGNAFNWVLTYTITAIATSYGTRLILHDNNKEEGERRYVAGTMFTIIFNMYMATQSITFSVRHMEVFATARSAAAGIFELIERKPSINCLHEGGISPGRVIGDIALEDIQFSYPSRPEVKILNGFNLKIKHGECVALVGSSGCGKSTVLQLLQRLYDPNNGSVKLDGKDLKNLNLNWLRSCLGVVGQEPVLFRGSIFENISLGCPEATREEVQRVAEMAYAHEFIIRLPNGYDTKIGERGASLSGGQKQRIAIARALLREPAVLLLDEATSALDTASERQVQAALDRASIGRTTIIVSHRLSTIVNANRIICMDQGHILEQGSHVELMKAKGFYYKFVTTSKEIKKPLKTSEQIHVFPEEGCGDSGVEIKQKELHSNVEKSNPIPRGSATSVMSNGLRNSSADDDFEVEKEENEVEKPIGEIELLKLNAPEWLYLMLGSIAAFCQGSSFPVIAVLLSLTAENYVQPDHDMLIYFADLYSGMYVLVAAVAGASVCLQGFAFTHAGLKMTTRLREQYFAGLLKQEMAFFDKESNTVGAICARLSGDAAEIQGATCLRIGLILQGFSSVFIGFMIAIFYKWQLTLIGSCLLPLTVGSIWLEGIVSRKSQQKERAAMESATAIATEALVSIRTVQSLGVGNIFMKKFEEEMQAGCAAVAKKTRWRGLVFGLGIFVPFLVNLAPLMYGVTLIARKEMKYQVGIMVNTALMYAAYMLGNSLVHAPSFNNAKDSAARILALICREPKVKTENGISDKKDWAATGAFSVKNAEFCYPTRPKQRVLRGFSLEAEAGKTVALVGSSGCGKSTILQLIQRFYDPDTGNIEMDGRDIRSAVTLPQLRRQLGVVQQEPVLFGRTIAENIAYGDNTREVTMNEIMAAAKAANIHSFVASLPQGYDTNLGSSGAQLSGGQKQRVCIARALIRSPRLLLLDEATSALDANSEKVVTEALEKAAKGRTCITIAHRLTTIKDADMICVVDKGKIVERGNHEELLSLRGHYWEMCREHGVPGVSNYTNTSE